MATPNVVERGSTAVSLAAVTATGVGTPLLFTYRDAGYYSYAWQVTATGAPASVSVTLEGSLDNVNWAVLDTSTTTTNELRFYNAKNAKFVRANLGTLTGGTAPTVTVTIAAF